MNISEALNWASQRLSQHKDLQINESAKVDAEFLLAFCLSKSFTWLKTWPEQQLESEQQSTFVALIERRFNGEPVAYITGRKSFWTLELETNESTLIPRAETELLVELALDKLANIDSARVLDLGTGTGAIGLSIASERKNDEVTACDFNSAAVKLAQRNAKRNEVTNIKILQSDWFDAIEEKCFELIVSNPPYVAESDPHLEQGDLIFEPDSALVSSGDGLDDIRHIVNRALAYLFVDCYLMVEHGFEQGKMVRSIFDEAGYQNIETKQDLSGNDRVTLGRKPR